MAGGIEPVDLMIRAALEQELLGNFIIASAKQLDMMVRADSARVRQLRQDMTAAFASLCTQGLARKGEDHSE